MKKLAVILLTALTIFHLFANETPSSKDSLAQYNSSSSVIPAYHFNPSFVKEINANLDSENIQVLPSTNPFVKIDIVAKQPETVPFYEVKSGELVIKSAKRKIQSGTVSVKVYIPKNHRFQAIYIKTKDGNVEVHRQYAKKIDIETDRGNIILNGIETKKTYVETKHGEAKILDLTSDYASIELYRHDLIIDKIKTAELSIETTSGNIKAERIQTEKLSVDSTCGDISLNFTSPISKNSSVYTKKGDVKIYMPKNSWCRYITSSKHGKFDNDFGSLDLNIKFTIESKNGNVSIIKK